MYPVSERFAAEVARSGHEAIAGLDLELPDGTLRALWLLDGSVTEDAGDAVRRRLDATVVDEGLSPLDESSPLFTGAVLRPWRGIRFADGTEERVPLGVLLAGDPVADLDNCTVTVSAEDRSAAVALAPLSEPWDVPAGSLLSVVVSDLLADRLPGCPPVRLECDDVTIAEDTFVPAQVDPWAALSSDAQDPPGLVFSAGRRLWFDVDGVPVLMPLSAQAAPVEMDGAELMLTARSGIDTSKTFGGVCVTSNVFGDDDPLVAVRLDPDPPSEMFARRLHFVAMDEIDNQDDLDAAADGLVAEWTGVRGTASWTQPPDPSMQAGDVRRVTGGVLTGAFEVRAVTTPLVSGSQSVETVERAL